jgi:protein-S-isoprenylcysteine O-methyltransferase Ste14
MKTALQATTTSLLGLALVGLALFWPAGTFDYWQAWVFIAVLFGLGAIYTACMAVKNPDVLRRRMRTGPTAETRLGQKFVAAGIYVMFTAFLLVSAFDHRFGWSHMPACVSVAGNVVVAISLGVTMIVVAQNNYAAATITVEAGQPVVSTGLYGIVRHPMYTAAFFLLVAVPFALGSYWALIALLPLPFGILDEERALTEELDGYRDYTQRVRYRLVPNVW